MNFVASRVIGPCPFPGKNVVEDPRTMMPADFHTSPLVRLTLIVLTILVSIVVAYGANGSLLTFPDKFLTFFHQINWMYVGIGAAAVVVLIAGAAIVIHKVRHTVDKHTNTTIGKLTGNDHWISCVTVDQVTKDTRPGHLDVSTLDETKSGYAFIYLVKGEYPHYSLMCTLAATAPIHMVGTIANHLLQLLIVPIYVLWNSEKYPSGTIWESTKYSLLNIVAAPFFCVARIFAAIYGLFDILNGRKLMTYLERMQIAGITRPRSFWSVRGFQELSEWRGFQYPGKKGQFNLIVAGCLQPVARVKFENGKAVLVESASRLEDSSYGATFDIFLSDVALASGLQGLQTVYYRALEQD